MRFPCSIHKARSDEKIDPSYVSQLEIVLVNCVMMVEALENTGYIVDVTRDVDNQKRS